MIACILLSAGLSQRFGSPKALTNWHGQTVIEHLQKMLVDTPVDEIIVVLGFQADRIKPHLLEHKKVKFVYNKSYNLGQTSSFKAGLYNISDGTQGALLLPVDYPLIQEDTIGDLINYFNTHTPLITVPTFEGQKGHPPLFSMDLRDEFLALENQSGLNTVVHAHQTETTLLPVKDQGVTMTYNTLEEFEAIKKLSELFKHDD